MFTCSLADGGGLSKVKVSSSLITQSRLKRFSRNSGTIIMQSFDIFSRMNNNEFIEPAGRHN